MAFASVYGIGFKSAFTGVQPCACEKWLAAAPVVALGAPLGVFVVNLIGRKPTLLFVAVLRAGQFIWTCHTERVAHGYSGLPLSILAVGACLVVFEKLRTWGAVLLGEAKAKKEAAGDESDPVEAGEKSLL